MTETEEPLEITDTADQTSSATTVITSNALSETINTTTYSVFIPDFQSVQPSLLSSTKDRYNDTIQNSLRKDRSVIQQTMDIDRQPHHNNFFRNVKWSPDGNYLLSNSADDVIRLFQLPSNAYESTEDRTIQDSGTFMMEPLMGIREGESVYDFAWYPLMNSQDPSTCCFLTSVKDHPVQLWDMNTGTVQSSYSVIDHCERFIGPNVITFNPDGTKIYCGYENMIDIFDAYTGDRFKHPTITTRKKAKKGQKGLISCLDFSPVDSLYAAGSYSQSIGIYDTHNNELCLKLVGFEGTGVTQVKFARDGYYLFSASRHANSILCWDIRDSANVLYELPRPGKTNQRIQFDLDVSGKYLLTGDDKGQLLVYDVTTATPHTTAEDGSAMATARETEIEESKQRLVSSFIAHHDILSGTSFNPVYPVVATCSGQRKFKIPDSSDDDDMDDDDDKDNDKKMLTHDDSVIDNSLKVWKLPGQYEWYTYDAPTTLVEEMETLTQHQEISTV